MSDYKDITFDESDAYTITKLGMIWSNLYWNEDLSMEEKYIVFDSLMKSLCLKALGYNSQEEAAVDVFLAEVTGDNSEFTNRLP